MPQYGDTVSTPSVVGGIDQTFLIEPLNGAKKPYSYLDRFPDEIYNKTPQSRLVKLMYALIGPSGVAGIKQNLLTARLALESNGLELFNLDQFYGDPFKFGRILDETHDLNTGGLLNQEDWDRVKAKDEAYRNRAVDFLKGTKAGNTLLGMRLIARSGLGHECEVIENYRYLYDQHTDDRLGIPYHGQTNNLEEFIVLPRKEVSTSEVQIIQVVGFPDGGYFVLVMNGNGTKAIPYDANYFFVQTALEALPGIGKGNVQVTGGPIPNPFRVIFRGALAGQNMPQLEFRNSLVDLGGGPDSIATDIEISTEKQGNDTSDETVRITSTNLFYLESALDRIRPVHTIPTVADAPGKVSIQQPAKVFASSQYVETRKFVTGQPDVQWPPVEPNKPYWIEPSIEKPAPVTHHGSRFHYASFHKVSDAKAYTDEALLDPDYLTDEGVLNQYKSEYAGTFSQPQRTLFPFLNPYYGYIYYIYNGFDVSPNNPVANGETDNSNIRIFDSSYPVDYLSLSRSPFEWYWENKVPSSRVDFWASLERPSGSEFIEIDLGQAQAVNYISFEITKKPVDIEIGYDVLDMTPARKFAPVYPADDDDATVSLSYEPGAHPWQEMTYHFQTSKGEIPFTRYIRIRISRKTDGESPSIGDNGFLFNQTTGVQEPWSIEVRNIRLGRVVSDVPATRPTYQYGNPYYWNYGWGYYYGYGYNYGYGYGYYGWGYY